MPRNWVERSVTFLANNRYVGWEQADLPLPGRWMDLETYTSQSLVTFKGPPPYAYPPPNRTAIDLGRRAVTRGCSRRPSRSLTGSNSERARWPRRKARRLRAAVGHVNLTESVIAEAALPFRPAPE